MGHYLIATAHYLVAMVRSIPEMAHCFVVMYCYLVDIGVWRAVNTSLQPGTGHVTSCLIINNRFPCDVAIKQRTVAALQCAVAALQCTIVALQCTITSLRCTVAAM
jgi:hypothetical protein